MASANVTYRVTILTPTLVGDGQRLSPIDYMVWKDHVNVLDQKRIFRLLSKGPRLDGYLAQLKKADKLDFGSWGGFAQNFAGRRIPFEHPSSTAHWERARAENLFIPTFAAGLNGPYLPASALKGALRTAIVAGLAGEKQLKSAAERAGSENKVSKQMSQTLEDSVLGGGGASIMRLIAASDSKPVPDSLFKVYLLRISTLESRSGKHELAWKQAPRGSARRPEEGTPMFIEMALPGTMFEGEWRSNAFLAGHEVVKALRTRERVDASQLWAAANLHSERLLATQAEYSDWAGLPLLKTTITELQRRLAEIREYGRGCLLTLGWGGGFLTKAAFGNTPSVEFRQILKQVPFYARTIQSGLPFPKTRKIVFLNNQPAALPGFVHLEVIGDT